MPWHPASKPWRRLQCLSYTLHLASYQVICISQFSFSVVFDSTTPWTAAQKLAPSHQQLPEFIQTQVNWVGDATQPSHSLLSSSPPTFNLSQHQGLFQWVSFSHQKAKVLESLSFNISPSKEHPGLISFKMDWLDLLAAKGLSRVFSNTTGQKHQFYSAQLSL